MPLFGPMISQTYYVVPLPSMPWGGFLRALCKDRLSLSRPQFSSPNGSIHNSDMSVMDRQNGDAKSDEYGRKLQRY
jgi:hypothetical protein